MITRFNIRNANTDHRMKSFANTHDMQNDDEETSKADVPNLFLTMYPFSISTDE